MALADHMGALDALPHELTTLDRHESKRRGWNPYALGHYLGAAEQVRADVLAGDSLTDAFCRHFTPTRGMHSVAKRLGLPVDVRNCDWVKVSPTPTAQGSKS